MENIKACMVKANGDICIMHLTPDKKSIEKVLGGEYVTFKLSGKYKPYIIAALENAPIEGIKENARFMDLFGDVLIMGINDSGTEYSSVGDRFNTKILMELILCWDLAREEEWK